MNLSPTFLGTGAAELYPNPFCACEVCTRARENREFRLRSCFLLDASMLIDFGPDLPAASQHYGVPLHDVRDVLITHTHEDHFSPSTFSILTMTRLTEKPMRFHLSQAGMRYVEQVIALEKPIRGSFGRTLSGLLTDGRIAFCPIDPFQTRVIGTKTVTPLQTNHPGYGDGETAQSYLISWERGGWLYASDTGLYGEETLGFLDGWAQKQGALDTLIIEGTFGSKSQPESASHMDAALLCKQFALLRATGALTDATQVYITHINPVQSFSHAQYQDALRAHTTAQVTVAHDGMRI